MGAQHGGYVGQRTDRALISVVVPCFNEQEVVKLTQARLVAVLGARREFDLEIVYVDDGSTDKTSEILGAFANEDDRVAVIYLSRNFGHQAAITAGLQHASGDAVAVIDADLQDPPEVILKMIDQWRNGYDVVYGVRREREEGWFKRSAYSAFYRLLRALARIEVPLDSGDFALLDRRAVDMLDSLPERVRFVRGLRAWIGLKQIGVPYERPGRAAGRSKYTALKLLRLGLDGIFSLSAKPLSLIFLLGVLASTASAVGFVFYLLWQISGIEIFGTSPAAVPGFTTVILLLFLLSGIQLISIGVIGEYIGRIYEETKGRPTYLSQRVTGARKLPRREIDLAGEAESEWRD